MNSLIKSIIKDFKESSITFVILFVVFFVAIYTQDQLDKKQTYSLTSEIIVTQPNAVSTWASFNQGQFKQDLYHFMLSIETKSFINERCEINNSSQKAQMAFNRDGFQYLKFSILHNKNVKDECMSIIFNEIILEFYNNYLSQIIKDNKILMEYMRNETLSINSNLFLSTFRDSYRSPQLIELKANIPLRSNSTNFTKIITISFIFSALISLFISALSSKYKKKNKKGS